MRKQVTFAESQTIHRLHQDDAFSRGMNEPNMALKDISINFNKGLKINRPPAARCEPQLQHVATKQIPKTTTAAPFLMHTALTPAQREYLHTMAASYSAAHVRSLITQHYMNVLHRCRPTRYNPEGDDLAGTSAALPGTDESNKHRSEVPSMVKHKEKMNASGRNPGKSILPKILNRQTRLSNTSASKQGKMKTCTSPSLRRTSLRRAKVRMLEEEEEEEEEGQYVSLSECLSSLSVGEWEDDTSSDL